MPVDEAIDLIRMLPQGSLWRGARWPEMSWSTEQHDLADIKDLLKLWIWSNGVYGPDLESPPRTVRPAHIVDLGRAKHESRRVKEILTSTQWEEA